MGLFANLILLVVVYTLVSPFVVLMIARTPEGSVIARVDKIEDRMESQYEFRTSVISQMLKVGLYLNDIDTSLELTQRRISQLEEAVEGLEEFRNSTIGTLRKAGLFVDPREASLVTMKDWIGELEQAAAHLGLETEAPILFATINAVTGELTARVEQLKAEAEKMEKWKNDGSAWFQQLEQRVNQLKQDIERKWDEEYEEEDEIVIDWEQYAQDADIGSFSRHSITGDAFVGAATGQDQK